MVVRVPITEYPSLKHASSKAAGQCAYRERRAVSSPMASGSMVSSLLVSSLQQRHRNQNRPHKRCESRFTHLAATALATVHIFLLETVLAASNVEGESGLSGGAQPLQVLQLPDGWWQAADLVVLQPPAMPVLLRLPSLQNSKLLKLFVQSSHVTQ